MLRVSSLALLAASAASAVAQGNLIGLGYDPAGAAIPAIIQQTLCQPGNRVCPAVGTVAALPAPWAGGAAANGRHDSVWYTDGIIMVEATRVGCRLLCRMPAARVLGAASFAGGLEILPGPGLMYQIESIPGAAMLHQWNIATCPPTPGPACQIPLPSAAHTSGGIAIDEANGQWFIATSIFGAGGPANVILGGLMNNPCNVVCRMPVQGCGGAIMGPIRGLCYDECRGLLYATDGNQTVVFRRNGATPCSFVQVACCNPSPNVGPYGWVGFDVEPQHAAVVGQACTGPNCQACPNMALATVGDPVLGNPTFALEVTGAPLGSVLAVGVAPGGCNAPGLPIFCGQWHPGIGATLFLPSVPVGGPGPCQGSASVALPIPTNFGLCGAPLCFQGVIVCVSAAGFGVGLTNALDVVLN